MGRPSRTWTPEQRAKAAETLRAANAARAGQRKANVCEDLEWIIGTVPAEDVAARLGYKDPDSLERILWTWERGDLAIRLHATRYTPTDHKRRAGQTGHTSTTLGSRR